MVHSPVFFIGAKGRVWRVKIGNVRDTWRRRVGSNINNDLRLAGDAGHNQRAAARQEEGGEVGWFHWFEAGKRLGSAGLFVCAGCCHRRTERIRKSIERGRCELNLPATPLT